MAASNYFKVVGLGLGRARDCFVFDPKSDVATRAAFALATERKRIYDEARPRSLVDGRIVQPARIVSYKPVLGGLGVGVGRVGEASVGVGFEFDA